MSESVPRVAVRSSPSSASEVVPIDSASRSNLTRVYSISAPSRAVSYNFLSAKAVPVKTAIKPAFSEAKSITERRAFSMPGARACVSLVVCFTFWLMRSMTGLPSSRTENRNTISSGILFSHLADFCHYCKIMRVHFCPFRKVGRARLITQKGVVNIG